VAEIVLLEEKEAYPSKDGGLTYFRKKERAPTSTTSGRNYRVP